MSKPVVPRSSPFKAFVESGKRFSPEVSAQVGPTLNFLDGKTPAQRAAVLDKTSPVHADLLAYLTLKLGHPVERVDMEMLTLYKDLTL
jgi:hypothetical protein